MISGHSNQMDCPQSLGDMFNIAVSFIAGIAAFRFYDFFPFVISTLSFGIILYLYFRFNDSKKILLIILVFICAVISSLLRNDDISDPFIPSEEVHIVGIIHCVPEISDGKLKFEIEEAFIEGVSIQGTVNLVIFQDIVSESLKGKMLLPGDRISAFAKLKKPGTFRNSGVYSTGSGKDRVSAVGYIKQMMVVDEGKGLMTCIHKKRQRLAWIMDNSLSEESAALHKAVIPGLKSGIGQEMRDGFSATGLAHLLSISGTHFGLLGFIMFTLVRGFVKRLPSSLLVRMTVVITPTQIAVLITLPVLISYAFISGASLPTIRSLVMVIIYMLALYLGRKDQWLNSLAIAAIVILIWNPGSLFELSFQLSFFAVLSIGAVMERYMNHDKQQPALKYHPVNHENDNCMKRMMKRSGATLIITIAAVMGTAPFVVIYFNRFPLISPLTNLIITPLICFAVLPLGFFTGFLALFLDMSLLPLAEFTEWLTLISLKLVKGFSHIPYATISMHSPTISEIILFYAGLLFIFRHKDNMKWRVIPVFLVIFIYLVRPYFISNNFSVTFLDVGQGEASIVQLPGNEVMLIDGGVQRPDIGRMVIAPFLMSKGIKDIDYMVQSHAHPDHYGGLGYIMDNFNVREVWTNGNFMTGEKSFLHRAEKNWVKHRILRRGDMLENVNYKITVLHPCQSFYADSPRGEFSDENSSSLVLKIEAENTSILFTGDIEEEAEQDMLYLDTWLKSDILKVPHHGGRTSSSADFIQAVRPKVAVVSAGKNNPFHHPHKTTVQRYKKAGVNLFRTDMNGAITITSVDDSLHLSTWQDGKLKKVYNVFDEIINLRLLFSD